MPTCVYFPFVISQKISEIFSFSSCPKVFCTWLAASSIAFIASSISWISSSFFLFCPSKISYSCFFLSASSFCCISCAFSISMISKRCLSSILRIRSSSSPPNNFRNHSKIFWSSVNFLFCLKRFRISLSSCSYSFNACASYCHDPCCFRKLSICVNTGSFRICLRLAFKWSIAFRRSIAASLLLRRFAMEFCKTSFISLPVRISACVIETVFSNACWSDSNKYSFPLSSSIVSASNMRYSVCPWPKFRMILYLIPSFSKTMEPP